MTIDHPSYRPTLPPDPHAGPDGKRDWLTQAVSDSYDAPMKEWEIKLLGPGNWLPHTQHLLRDEDGEIALPTPETAENYVYGLNEVELFLLRAQAGRLRRRAFWSQVPFLAFLGWFMFTLLVVYPVVHYNLFKGTPLAHP